MNEQAEKNAETPMGAASELSAGLGGWRPIETAPKWGSSRHLAVMKNGTMAIIVWLDADHPDVDEAGWYEHWGFDPVEPTHWMPLPMAPNAALNSAGACARPVEAEGRNES